MTSENVGPVLFLVARISNTIENLMRSGMIDEESRKIYDENELVAGTEKWVARNYIDSLKTLASWHESGSHGFDKDDKKSRELVDKSSGVSMKKRAEEGDAESM